MNTVEKMTLEDVKFVLEWAADEGWNPGLDDANAFFQADPNGFLIVKDGQNKTACISVVRQGDHHGFLGLYICHPNHRGKGYGWTAWQAGMEYLNKRTIGLDGVPEQQDNYRKSGFEYHYRNIRFTGIANGLYSDSQLSTLLPQNDFTISKAHFSDFSSMEKLDSHVHGLNRHHYLKSWLSDTNNRKTLVCTQQSKIVGFGTIRVCQQGYKIGPLIAQNISIARLLVSKLANSFNANELIVDVPEPNNEAINLAMQFGLTPSFETARMYRGNAPQYQLKMLYGVTSFELG